MPHPEGQSLCRSDVVLASVSSTEQNHCAKAVTNLSSYLPVPTTFCSNSESNDAWPVPTAYHPQKCVPRVQHDQYALPVNAVNGDALCAGLIDLSVLS